MTRPNPPSAIPPDALLSEFAPPIVAAANDLRALVREAIPEAMERVRTGWRVIGLDAPAAAGSRRRGRTAYFAWVMVQPEHVHLGLVWGTAIPDPDGRIRAVFDGAAKRARWLTLEPGSAIADRAFVIAALRAARDVAHRTPLERALGVEGPPGL